MNVDEYINSARNSLARAKRELEPDQSCTRVPSSLSNALTRAMEAWLLAHGHENGSSHGLEGYATFTDHAPKELASGFRRCWAETSTLDFLLLGDSTTDAATFPSLEEWTVRADNCIIECEKIVAAIMQNLRAQDEQQA